MTWTNQSKSLQYWSHHTLINPFLSLPLYPFSLLLFKTLSLNKLIFHPKKISQKKKKPTALEPNPAREVIRPPPVALRAAADSCPPMSDPHAPHAPPRTVARGPKNPLYKQRSWSPDTSRDEAWLRRKQSNRLTWQQREMPPRGRSVTDEDLDELKACIELGFGFGSGSGSGSPEPADQRLADTLPALGLYYAVNKHYNDSLAKPSAVTTPSNSSTPSECDSPSPSPLGSPHTMFGPDDTPQTVKTRLRQWAQVVACSVKQCSS